VTRASPQTDAKLQASQVVAPLTHAAVYRVCCGRCGASTVCPVAHDTVRMICPSCGFQLTLPGTLEITCPSCSSTNEYPHTLAGHSASCQTCGATVSLPPLVGRARHRHSLEHHHHYRRRRSSRTLAFSESAERAVILAAAAIAALILVAIIGVQ